MDQSKDASRCHYTQSLKVLNIIAVGNFFDYLEAAQQEYNGVGEFTFQPIMQKMIDEGHSILPTKSKMARTTTPATNWSI